MTINIDKEVELAFTFDQDDYVEKVILAAMELLPNYDEIELESKGTIRAKKDGIVDVYDYYRK